MSPHMARVWLVRGPYVAHTEPMQNRCGFHVGTDNGCKGTHISLGWNQTCFIFKLTCVEKKRRRYVANSWYYPGHRKLTVMLWSHYEAPGQFTGPLRTKIKETRANPGTHDFWRILDPYGRRGAPYSPTWLKVALAQLSDTGFFLKQYFGHRRHV